MEKSTVFNVGDTVYTDTHGKYQNTQESLSRLKGVVVNNEDKWNIHVMLENKPHFNGAVGFSEYELSHTPITEYKNEKLS
jgi:hypothetical protein